MNIGLNTAFYPRLISLGPQSDDLFETILNPYPAIKEAVEGGVRHFEISCDLNFTLFPEWEEKQLEALRRIKDEHKNVSWTVHLPFRGMEFAHPARECTLGNAALFSRYIKLFEEFSPHSYVVHPFGKLCGILDQFPENHRVSQHFLSELERGLHAVLDETGIFPEKIALENVRTPFSRFEKAADDLGVGFCFDFGHHTSGVTGNETITEILDRYFDRIREIHLHDVYLPQRKDEKVRDHLPIGAGNAPIGQFLKKLENRKFSGPIVLEVKTENPLSSYNACKNLLSSEKVEY